MAVYNIFNFGFLYTGCDETQESRENCVLVSQGGSISLIASYKQMLAHVQHNLEHTYIWHDFTKDTAVPGFIDMHVHGGGGVDVMDGCIDSLNGLSKHLASKGITAFMATTVSAPIDRLKEVTSMIADGIDQGLEGAMCLGCYLEGPFLAEERKGAHAAEYLQAPTVEVIDQLIETSRDTLRIVAIAPEYPESLKVIKYLKQKGIKSALGHTDIDSETAEKAFDQGASIAVHLFNGMRPFHHREGGLAATALTRKDVYAELIADKIHVHESVLRLVLAAKAKDEICLISDCMCAGGLGDGTYLLGDLEVQVKDGIARVDSGSLAGSTLDLGQAMRNIMETCGKELAYVLPMLSQAPARACGVDRELGTLELGKRANITVLNQSLEVVATIVSGRVVYEREGL